VEKNEVKSRPGNKSSGSNGAVQWGRAIYQTCRKHKTCSTIIFGVHRRWKDLGVNCDETIRRV
jgi:hypothetical protein